LDKYPTDIQDELQNIVGETESHVSKADQYIQNEQYEQALRQINTAVQELENLKPKIKQLPESGRRTLYSLTYTNVSNVSLFARTVSTSGENGYSPSPFGALKSIRDELIDRIQE